MNAEYEAKKNRELYETEMENLYKDLQKQRVENEYLANSISLCIAGGHLSATKFEEAKDFVVYFYKRKI